VSQIRLIAVRDTPLSVDGVRDAIADPAARGEVFFLAPAGNCSDPTGALPAGL
jgi:hypothetical protein